MALESQQKVSMKTKTLTGLECPVCHADLAFGEKMQQWDTEYGNDVTLDAEFPAMINVFCEHCNKPVATVYIELGGMEVPEDVQEIMAIKTKELEETLKKEKN